MNLILQYHRLKNKFETKDTKNKNNHSNSKW